MESSVLRILDANANRAREALRVIEDYARFGLNDMQLSAAMKALRHELGAVLGPILPEAILHRDTPGDVGTSIKTAAEQNRESLADVVTAAGKRAGEALRAIEEFCKIHSPRDGARVETLRYRLYDIEAMIARTLRPDLRCAQLRLCVLITEKLCKHPWTQVAQEVVEGGADCLQLREKEMDGGELLARARTLVELCRARNVLCIINDRPDVAMLSGADGVHVGQQDLPARDVRKLIGSDKILGVSTHSLDHARQALRDGGDYIGVGPLFRSETKPRDFVAGAELARQVAREIPLPAIAIAGINEHNVDQVLETGIRAVAVCAAVISDDDPTSATRRLKLRLEQAKIPATQAI